MNIPLVRMPADEAKQHLEEYKAALAGREPSAEDESILLGYKALAAGRDIVDLAEVFRGVTPDDQGRPRLAVARADWKWCHLRVDRAGRWVSGHGILREPTFCFVEDPRDYDRKGPLGKVRTPAAADWPVPAPDRATWHRALVPLIPPAVRPGDTQLRRYHVLFEAEWEPVPPVDPLLLRRLTGTLYVVLAAWNLTPLERAVLAGRLAAGPG